MITSVRTPVLMDTGECSQVLEVVIARILGDTCDR